MPRVRYTSEARDELKALPVRERAAMLHVIDKLAVMGALLRHPHQSAVKGAPSLRELRPRGGDSPWRAFYRQVDADTFVIAAIGAEANVDPRDFARSVQAAGSRLTALRQRNTP